MYSASVVLWTEWYMFGMSIVYVECLCFWFVCGVYGLYVLCVVYVCHVCGICVQYVVRWCFCAVHDFTISVMHM